MTDKSDFEDELKDVGRIKNQKVLIEEIRSAFATGEYPGDWCLVGSHEGSESAALAEAFKGKIDRYSLDPKFLDSAPKSLGSALSFFSDEAFRFYLPAYMIADISGKLENCDLVFHLTHGLDDKSSGKRINPRRFGQRTWLDHARYKFSIFTHEESSAIVAYLRFKQKGSIYGEGNKIDEALKNYWNSKAD